MQSTKRARAAVAGRGLVAPLTTPGSPETVLPMTDPLTLERLRLIADPDTLAAEGVEIEDLMDADIRADVIRAEHPDLDHALQSGEEEVLIHGEPVRIPLHFALHEVVATQLAGNDPPDVSRTAFRLLEAGYDRHQVLHMLAGTMVGQIRSALADHASYDLARHIAALDALPGEWGAPRSETPLNRAERRARTRRKRRRS